LSPGTHAIVLEATTGALRHISGRLEAAGVDHSVIVENEGEYEDQIMAIGVKPKRRSQLKKYFSSLPLLR
jgi:hypothetical protein